jgi:hypothetical protein
MTISNDQITTKGKQKSKSRLDSDIKGRKKRNNDHIENNNQEIFVLDLQKRTPTSS